MIKKNEAITMRAIALCFKRFLKPEEAMIYCNLERTQFAKNCKEHRIFKTSMGYYNREELDSMMEGKPSLLKEMAAKLAA